MHDSRMPVSVFHFETQADGRICILHPHQREDRHQLFCPEKRMIYIHLAEQYLRSLGYINADVRRDHPGGFSHIFLVGGALFSGTAGFLDDEFRHLADFVSGEFISPG